MSVVYVPSQSTPNLKYMIVRGTDDLPWYCNCPAFKYDKRQYDDEPGERACKHIEAVKLLDAQT